MRCIKVFPLLTCSDPGMKEALLLKYSRPVPRYTSYPTAPHFHAGIDSEKYSRWLEQVPQAAPLSLYIHIPFCDSLCWFCGCHMQVVRDQRPLVAYVDLLLQELELLSRALGGRPQPLLHLHFGGGSPCLLPPREISRIADSLWRHFTPLEEAEIAVEMDPRGLHDEAIHAFAQLGATRASIGVQDLNPEVQLAINRYQPFAVVADAAARLRDAGIERLNFDLMYGLPYQTKERVLATVKQVVELSPDRLALFGYAHVPHMKSHQRLLPEAALPGELQRLQQAEAAARCLLSRGYHRVGLDHFARADDPLEQARKSGRLQRNFQGYTVDAADVLLGLGVSAIGTLPQGYVQNVPSVPDYRRALGKGRLPVARGIAVTEEDRRDRDIINSLMCDYRVDLQAYGGTIAFPDALARLAPMISDGLVTLQKDELALLPEGRPLVRIVAAAFDRHLRDDHDRHSLAI